MLWKSVPDPYSGDWKCAVAVPVNIVFCAIVMSRILCYACLGWIPYICTNC